MLKFPAPAADRPLLSQLKTVGIGPGLSPAHARLSADTLRGLRDAVTQGPSKVLSAALALYLKGFAKHNGYLVADLGGWGTNYALRAIGDKLGVGGQRASIATYPIALLDDTKAPLTGSKRYVIHIPKSSLPIPVKAFWSLTMYDTNSFFVPNPLNRYLINNRSHLHTNPDGSIDIYIQHNEPSNPAEARNWLPAPARARIPSGLAPVRPRPRRIRRAQRIRLAAAARPAVRPQRPRDRRNRLRVLAHSLATLEHRRPAIGGPSRVSGIDRASYPVAAISSLICRASSGPASSSCTKCPACGVLCGTPAAPGTCR